DMPKKDGESADYSQQRYWKSAADVELQLRDEGKARQEASRPDKDIYIYQPLRALDDEKLKELRKTGSLKAVGLEGYELEHKRIPQRAEKMFADAGIPADEARRLAHVADPNNLEAMDKAMHAASDRQALNQPTRNPSLNQAVVAAEKGDAAVKEADEKT